MIDNSKKPSILRADLILYAIIFIGIILRIYFYLYNRPFWLDECALLLNLVQKNNYFYNLEWVQTAPAFFLYISRFIYSIFPDNTFALRFLPLFCSISSIFFFVKLSKTYLKKPIAILIATVLFSVMAPLIYYGQEFKPYSADVLLFMLILLTYPYLEQINSKKSILLWGIFYSLMFYVSYASFFAEFGLFATLLLFNPKQFKKIVFILIPIIISAAIFYICFLSFDLDFLKAYWTIGFLSSDIDNDIWVIINFFVYLFQNWFILIIFLASLLYTIKKDYKNKDMCLFLFPILCIIPLSFLKLYPLHSRVCLFLAPVIIIFIVKWIDFLNIKSKILYSVILIIFAVITTYPSISIDYKTLYKKQFILYNDIRTPLIKAKEMAKEDDIFIISFYNEWLYEYNKLFVPIKNPVIVERDDIETNEYIKQLESYPKNKTYFWIESHHNHEDRVNAVYEWAKTKDEFFCQKDSFNNTVIRYRL